MGTSKSNELNLLKDKVESSAPQKAFLDHRTPSIAAQIYPLQLQLEGSCSGSGSKVVINDASNSNDNSSATPPNKECFLYRHLDTPPHHHHQPQGLTDSYQPSDFLCYFPPSHAFNASFSMNHNQNPTPWFAHSGSAFDVNYDAISSVVAPVTGSVVPDSSPTTLKPSTTFPSSMGSHSMSWESGAANSSTELQSSTCMFEKSSSMLSWGSANNEAQVHVLEGEGEGEGGGENMKWSEYPYPYPLHNQFSDSQNQIQTPQQVGVLMYEQIKYSEMHFMNNGYPVLPCGPVTISISNKLKHYNFRVSRDLLRPLDKFRFAVEWEMEELF
ncbi:hypothetical protein F0562_021525 [Nyssa sinensis]|uniref:Uncharacterized protein n=1 Tax=Nyssa sinensis TaxID=561372 RepID=A0A5J5BL78_9ASTE|nr:hypothetical protein F0562_021525 [Nyssa sinensis]